LQKPREQANRLHPPHTLILEFTLTHTCYERSSQDDNVQLIHTRRSDGDPEPDGVLKKVVRDKIRHYRQIYLNRPDSILRWDPWYQETRAPEPWDLVPGHFFILFYFLFWKEVFFAQKKKKTLFSLCFFSLETKKRCSIQIIGAFTRLDSQQIK
jgi:hypothetical protein